MDLLEYQAKELFLKYNIPATNGFTADSLDELVSKASKEEDISYPVVVKAQVQTGGRGKLGGIRFACDKKELEEAAKGIFGLNIKGHITEKVLVAGKAELAREFYLSVILDRNRKCPVIIFSKMGGVDIEQVAGEHPEAIVKVPVDPIIGLRDHAARYLSVNAGLTASQYDELNGIIGRLYKFFTEYNCLLCEINPLGLTPEGHFIAVDGKVTIDDSALKKLPDILEYSKTLKKAPLTQEAEKHGFLYIPCDESGKIAVMSNGSGMIMSCIDMLTKSGMPVKASLDLGGGATGERIKEAVRMMLSDDSVRMLFINIFGGITRCDEVAQGIRMAIETYKPGKPVVVRFEGTNRDKGLEILETLQEVVYVPDLQSGILALADYMNRNRDRNGRD